MFGTKCPSITSICRTVPPPSRAALVSTPSCAKFAARMDGTSSILGNASLLGQRSPRLYAQHLGYLGEMYYLPQRAIANFCASPGGPLPGNCAPLAAAFLCHLQHPHDLQRIFRTDRQLCASQNCVPNVGVIVAVIARCGW